MPVSFEIHPDDAGQRVDRFLRKLLPIAPLSMVHRLLRKGSIRVDGDKVDGKHRLEPGSRFELQISDQRFAELSTNEELPKARKASAENKLRVVYQDAHLCVVDKPGGLAVHGGSGLGDEHLMSLLRESEPSSEARTFRPAPAHRIDRATSGLLVIGRSAQALRALTAAFRDRRVEKEYLAVVIGKPSPAAGTIELALDIAERADSREAKAQPSADGLAARSRYRTVRSRHGLSLVAVQLDTGRSHQIRAHLASKRCPIIGDSRYGAPTEPKLGRHRIALHAERLRLQHPVEDRMLELEATLPADLRGLLDD